MSLRWVRGLGHTEECIEKGVTVLKGKDGYL